MVPCPAAGAGRRARRRHRAFRPEDRPGAARLRPGGLLVAGFSVRPDRLPLDTYDRLCGQAGLEPVDRWSTWSRDPYEGGDYAVSVHRRAGSAS